MAYMLKYQAMELLGPYERILFGIPADAIRSYAHVDFAPLRHRLGKRSDASIIHDLMIDLASDRLDCLDQFTYQHSQGLHYYYVTDGTLSATLRFKKLDTNMRSNNIPTEQACLFNHQDYQGELPNMPPIASLTLGYILDPTRTSAASVYVTMPDGNRNIWTWQLNDDSSEQIPHIPTHPLEDDFTPTVKARVKSETAKNEG